MSEDAPSFLVVDDDDRLRPRLARALRDRGYAVREAASGEEAVELARHDSPEYVALDLRMGGMNGLETLRALKALDPTTRVVVFTGYGSIATAVEAVRLGAIDYVSKPCDADQLLAAFHREPGSDPVTLEVASLARVEWEHIERVMLEADGNITVAAKLLGLHRRSLQRKLAKNPARR